MKKEEPEFSVIVTAYNQENFIENTLESLSDQTFKNFEVIVVDDGSIDGTVSILENYPKDSLNLRILKHKENKSTFMSRLTGIKEAKGKFILLLDGDDTFFSDALQKLHDEVILKESFDVCEFSYYQKAEKSIFAPIEIDKNISRIEQFALEEMPSFSMVNKLYDAKVIKKSFIDIPTAYMNVGEDCYQSLCVALNCKKYIAKNILVFSYNTESGITSKKYTLQKNEINFTSLYNVIQCTQKLLTNKLQAELSHKILHNIQSKLLDWAMVKIKYQTEKQDITKSYLLLPKYFDIKYLQNDFDSLYGDALKYRNGQFSFVNFLKKIYHKIKKIWKTSKT